MMSKNAVQAWGLETSPSFPGEGAWACRGDGLPEAQVPCAALCLESPGRADGGGAVIIQVGDPMRGLSRDAPLAPAGVHHLLRYGVKLPAYISVGQEQGGIGATCMLEAVELDNECRVRVMAPTEAV